MFRCRRRRPVIASPVQVPAAGHSTAPGCTLTSVHRPGRRTRFPVVRKERRKIADEAAPLGDPRRRRRDAGLGRGRWPLAQAVTLKFHTFMAPQSSRLAGHARWLDEEGREGVEAGGSSSSAIRRCSSAARRRQLYDQVKDGVVDVIWTLPGNTAGPLSAGRGIRAAVHDDQRRGDVEGVLGIRPDHAKDEFKDVHLIASTSTAWACSTCATSRSSRSATCKGMKIRGPTRQVTKLLASWARRR